MILIPLRRVLLDDADTQGKTGGGGYEKFGIDPSVCALVAVRPDGYVGMVAPLDRADALNAYFEKFMMK